jgi:DNA-binding transcriptional LysR family regulator
VRVEAHDRKRLEQLCRYITRPALSDEHLLISPRGGSFSGAVDETLARSVQSRKVRLSVSAASSVPQVLLDTGLIASVPETFARHLASRWGLEVRELPFAVPGYAVQMIWHANPSKSRSHQALRAAMVECTRPSTF